MIFKNFRYNLIVRILVLLGGLVLLAVVIHHKQYIRAAYLSVAIVILIIEFFYYVDKTNRDLNQFLSSVLHDDFSASFRDFKKGKSFKQLYQTFNLINHKFMALTREKETRTQYLHSLIEQVEVGIASLDESGNIQLMNKAFREMLDLPTATIGSRLYEISPEFMNTIHKIRAGEHHLVRMKVRGKETPFAVRVTGFKIEEVPYKLVSVQDIRAELDEKELEAWQKLIRVLTHEIMNSVTPIVSLSNSLHDILKNSPGFKLENKMKNRMSDGLEAIIDRSSGLMKFTEAYKNLTRLPKPSVKEISVRDLLKRIESLYKPQMKDAGVRFIIEYAGQPLHFLADIDLVEQVLINLIKNAYEAVVGKKDARIKIEIQEDLRYQVKILIEDNGPGIPPENLDKIFVPFYSTKKTGTGIGLSLSKQIILMHKGTIEVQQGKDKGCTFVISL